MMAANAIYITNLPQEITEAEIRSQLAFQIPELFESETSVRVIVFKNVESWSALLSGFNVDYHQLRFRFRTVMLISGNTGKTETSINLKLDTGEKRDTKGKFLHPKPRSFRRRFEQLAGITERKCFRFFTQDFLNDLNPNIFRQFNPTLFFSEMEASDLIMMELRQPGLVIYRKPTAKGSLVRYGSPLETIQAIAYLNHNPQVSRQGRPCIVGNDRGDYATVNMKSGISLYRTCVDFEGLKEEFGFIPTDAFRHDLVDTNVLKAVEESLNCWKCKGQYTILGVDLYLDWFAGKCKCAYDRNLSATNRSKAIFWPGEQFTRLIFASMLHPLATRLPSLCIQYYPMKIALTDTADYLNIVLPLLFEDWKAKSSQFKSDNRINADIVCCNVIEELLLTRPRKVVVSLKLRLTTRTAVWIPENPNSIRKLKLGLHVNRDLQITIEERKAKLYRIEQTGNNLFLIATMEIPKTYVRNLEPAVSVTPKPNKSEYNGLLRTLKKLDQYQETAKLPLFDIFFDPRRFMNTCLHKYKENENQGDVQNTLKTLLNENQLKSVQTALANSISFIHGPPGTGKTYTVAILVSALLEKENGWILVTAPSNHAANNAARSIVDNSFSMNPPNVIRIFAKSKESYGLTSIVSDCPGIPLLDEEVKKDDDWLRSDNVAEFANIVRCGKLELLQQAQSTQLEKHIASLERKILNRFNVIVTTTGCLMDQRLSSYSKERPASTVIVDEAGQLPHPMTISALFVNPRRIVFAGDPEQLPPTVTSYAAESAGLNLSLMEMVFLTAEQTSVPWNTLNVQHRMHPDIRRLVSETTYQGKLKDADEVKSRHVLYGGILESFCNGKRIFVANHDSLETQIGSSFVNRYEGDCVINLTNRLIAMGVPKQDIVILTFYDAQKKLLMDKLGQGVTIKNVDAFQGKESKIIIVSFVRSNTSRDIGFMTSGNRLNVAVSRAQEYLFLCMNSTFFSAVKIQHWKIFMDILKKTAFYKHIK